MLFLQKSIAGATLAIDPMPSSSSVSIGIWLPYGSRNEKPHSRGFFHFIEHMLFKGTHYTDARGLARVFERSGGYINAFSERSATCIYCTVPHENWWESFQTIIEMAFFSVFPLHEFEKEKAVIISEILQTNDDPEERAHDLFFKNFWRGQAIGLPIAGEVSEVDSISRDVLYSFYINLFHPQNAFISIAGNIDEKRAVEQIATKFQQFSAQCIAGEKYSDFEDNKIAVAESFSLYKKSPSSLSYVIQAIENTAPRCNREYLCNAILNEIIGGSTISRLFQSLREDKGLCYTVFSSFEPEASESVWIFHLQTTKQQLFSSLDALEQVISNPAASPLTTAEFDDARSRVSGLMKLAMDESDFRQRRMARQYFAYRSIETLQDELASIASIHYDEIEIIAEDLFRSIKSRFVFGAVQEKALKKRGYGGSE